MKKVILALMVLVAIISFGCGKKGEEEAVIKVAMVTDVGGVNDQSFNQSAWEGLSKAATDFAIKVSYLESKQDADYDSNLETVFDGGNDIIWGIGFKMADKIKEAATKNPDQKYAIIDFSFGDETPANVTCVVFKEQEGSFLVGYIAAKMSKTGKVGFVGGMDFDVIHRFKYGYLSGVKFANPKAEIVSQYAASFSDAAKGKAITNQMYKNGADVVFHAAGGVGDGVIEAGKEKNKMVIGVDRDQSSLAPENVITSAMKRVDNAIYGVVKKYINGTWEGGKTISYGLVEGGVDIAPTSYVLVPKDILDEVEGVKKDIIDGKIKVPSSEVEYNEWLKSN